ncbi:MAG TPA: protein kinase, partial [Pyrinomonadaceae bacterium]|nr:protein kinase [Pyrinomonadaceae bacterium]
LFHAALPLDDAARAAHLEGACAGDEGLRAEVESLLAAIGRREGFLEENVFDAGLEVLSGERAERLTGKRIGCYQVLGQLGRGGMGEVYLAEDTQLGRKVALKFLSGKLVDDNWAKRQLVKEAQAVAIAEHPNICPIYGFEEVEGHSFIVMQYVEGETLADYIAARRPDVAAAVSLGVQIVAAVAEAHSHGMIHRDIKPQNVMVDGGGQVKVLDFGLAKIVQRKHGVAPLGEDSSRISQAGLVIGTVAYMSPEQLRAERLDFRSDIFSLGTVLYELLTGQKPFARTNSAEIISAILTARPPRLSEHSQAVPPELDRIVFKCLEKDRDQRYQSASELLYDLGNLQHEGNAPTRRPALNLAAAALALLLLLVVLSAFAYHRFTRPYKLAVLPIANESGDGGVEYLGDSLAESMITKFSHLPGLRVSPFTAVSGYRGGQRPPQEAGRELDADVVLVGRIVREGNSLVLKTELVDASDGAQLWGARYDDINTTPISNLQLEITGQVGRAMKLPVKGGEQKLLAAQDPDNEEAIREYFRGRYLWRNRNKENIQKAVEKFNAAIALDPSFARAYAGLADCYALMNSPAYGNLPTDEAMNRARAAAKQALDIDNALPEAHTSLGVVHLKYDWDWAEAESRFQRAISLDPDYAPAHYWYSHLLTVTGRQTEALAESELARKLDPLSPLTRMNFCREFYFGRQFDTAATCLQEMLREDPANVNAQRTLGFVYLQKGMNNAAIEIFEKIPDSNRALKVVALGYSYARAGRTADALRILAEVEEMAQHTYIPPHERAVIYLGLDDKDRAFYWLNKACDEHFATMIYLTVDPAFDTLRADRRFDDLTRRVKLKPAQPA